MCSMYCVSDNDGAIVDPIQLTELRWDRSHCSILKKTKPFDKIKFSMKKEGMLS